MIKYLPVLNLIILLSFPVDTFLLPTQDYLDMYSYLSVENVPKSADKNYTMNTVSGEEFYLGNELDYLLKDSQQIIIEKTSLYKCPVKIRFEEGNEDATWKIGALNRKLNTTVFYFILILLCLIWIYVSVKNLRDRRLHVVYFVPIGTVAFILFYFT